MSDSALPQDIRDFLAHYVHSVEELEILLMLHAQPEEAWTVEMVYERILSSTSSVEARLLSLVEAGLVAGSSGDPQVRRFSASGSASALVAELAALYRAKPVRVIEAIYGRPADPARSFADAFKLSPRPQQP